ncbi:beta-ketoacyl synthase N-terminal-like domain-containing protein [Marinimicrobium sp. ABcell2]|uniref:beta-ketoacyl synthase N-terminal-like domain-containing protein n=1 Tax=Marinimicrobium sp. ABcell2 TaxID=3069751 RepID=UPI0027B45C47|nr:beta-ketoacyl synthase N-terminal-like domain-containing protein [Marinimicrobium sp. ABcell2]MDQ2076983.1 beta-ketoacyl synthase N-terminal-like domain-containing protein [Marinimicrobium sp. ABcell2]
MPTYIHHVDTHCALGRGLEPCVAGLLAAENPLSEIPFDQLRDPVHMPYFALPLDTTEDDFYQQLESLCANAVKGLSAEQRRRTALLLGSSSFDVQVSEQLYRADLARRGNDQAVPMPIVGYGKLAQRIGDKLGLSLQRHSYSTACTSSANAILYGHRLLEAGLVDHALVLGLERFNHTSVLGFYGLGLISPGRAMRPFAQERDGLLLGEAVGLLLLSRETPAAGKPWLRLCGGAIGTDNHSLTAANTDGQQLAQVVQQALADSQIDAQDLVGVKVHGTASLKNDEAEAAALGTVFGGSTPPAFALKPFLGHTLGACGAVETALTLGCLGRGKMPANPGIAPDPVLKVNLAQSVQPAATGPYLFNCFAFGGNNNALVISLDRKGTAA